MRRTLLGFLVLLATVVYSCKTVDSTRTEIRTDPALAAELDHDVKEILEQIAGRENEPAEKVFKNVRLMKSIPAARFLRIMNVGYSRSLGVECSHCHVEEYWDVDEKRPKRAAREMIVMTQAINEKLAGMENLESDERSVNCGTCHRGEVRPASSARR